jgi:hypothetical protein
MSEIEDDEGMDFVAHFKGEFASANAVRERLARERKAARTPAQKARKGPPTKQKNFRATADTLAKIEALAKLLDLNDTDVIVMAVDELAKARLGVKE